jgi:hypothetical protein
MFESNEDANAFMSGSGFAANPIGVEYDPEEWLAQKKAGIALAGFLVRRLHEPVSPIRGRWTSSTTTSTSGEH